MIVDYANGFRFVEGPDIGWYHQMKDSCNGFDTRIDMDQRKKVIP